ncbi:MAG TPA: winged helix-turn-helix domain-containing protein [Acidobacteriaceae bacterium]|nr:winged helix-turn-helix domain-containing protein [Acidobacteriaceae bacterium]
MAAHEISKKNQTAQNQTAATTWRFGEFQLDPGERLLQRNQTAVPLSPKTFDALFCLVSRAGRLVTKDELMQTVWPATFVAEANLTNAIVTLRKVVGRDAIRTVSKHGYRFELPVEGEPGVGRELYQTFNRARELVGHRSIEGVAQAREMLWLCLAENPGFAPAWAWLGRACAILAKFAPRTNQVGSHAAGHVDLAHAAFRRAFAIDPDLACAHQFFTSMQTDMGEARHAMQRLGERLRCHPAEPESWAGLVQALRFCGLLDESIEAHRRAKDLDPTIHTSAAHTWFLKGDYGAAIETYSGRAGLYLDAAAWAAMGQNARARELLQQRVARADCSALMMAGMASLLAILEGRTADAAAIMEAAGPVGDMEMVFYFGRHFAYTGICDKALGMITEAVRSGFVCAPQTLRTDPWLAPLGVHPDFPALLENAEKLTREARMLWESSAPATQQRTP